MTVKPLSCSDDDAALTRERTTVRLLSSSLVRMAEEIDRDGSVLECQGGEGRANSWDSGELVEFKGESSGLNVGSSCQNCIVGDVVLGQAVLDGEFNPGLIGVRGTTDSSLWMDGEPVNE